MKQRIFTLVMMLAMVVVAGKTFAQKNTPAPGETYRYTVNNLPVGDGVEWAVNQSTTDFTAVSAGTSSISGDNTVAADDTAGVTITWDCADVVGSVYNIWIKVSHDGYSNYRYYPVTITASPFDASILALGTSTAVPYPNWDTETTGNTEDCQVFIPGSYDFSLSADDDGDSYLYFTVTRENGHSNNWGFTVGVTVITSPTIDYSVDGTNFGTGAGYNTGLASTVDKVLVRVRFVNDPAGFANVVGTVTAIEGSCGSSNDSTPGNDTDQITVKPMPNLDSATFN